MKSVCKKIVIIGLCLLLFIGNAFVLLTISSDSVEPAKAESDSTYINLGNSYIFSLFDSSQLNQTFNYDYETPRYLYFGFRGSETVQLERCNELKDLLSSATSVVFYLQNDQGLFLLENVATLNNSVYPSTVVDSLPAGTNPFVLSWSLNNYRLTSNTITPFYSYYLRIPIVSTTVKVLPLSNLSLSSYAGQFQQNYGVIMSNSAVRPIDYYGSIYNSDFAFSNYNPSYSLFGVITPEGPILIDPSIAQSVYTYPVETRNAFEYFYPGLRSILFNSVNTVEDWYTFATTVSTNGVRVQINNDYVYASPLVGTVSASPVFNEFLVNASLTFPIDIVFPTSYPVTALGYPSDQITIVNETNFDFGTFGSFFALLGSSFEGFFKILSIRLFGIPLGVLLLLPLFASIIIFTIKIIRG